MQAASSKWSQWVNGNAVLEFIDVTLRGCAQVMFQNNPLTGLLFFAAIFVGAFAEGHPAVAFGCVLGTVAATFTGMNLKDRASWKAGLYGYNGCLVGVGLPTFLDPTPTLWLCIILASVVSVIVTLCIADILKTWKVAALTAPFVLVTWTMLLASYAFGGLSSNELPVPNLPHDLVAYNPNLFDGIDLFHATFYGISEVFLLSTVVGSLLFLAGLAVSSLWAALFGLLGSFLAVLVATLLQAEHSSINNGLYAFSAVLTAIALGSTFNKPRLRVLIYTVIGVIFTVFVQGALNTVLGPIGIPTLTMPFVLASWLFLVPNKDVMPAHRQ
ncbi:urea transporter [Pseudomonas endophytica]|uniref:Urea transporter n=1 Tax=Pseudomonas endophytica TaxID=1563157 RepID=A0A0Q0SXY0_9PSED|nr:urea transporter [Pseudomonas endophytica]KQB51741.1 urea transporter [Pseudomonas endophytica]